MVTRLPTLAFFGLIFALANYVHDKPHQAKKETAQAAADTTLQTNINAKAATTYVDTQDTLKLDKTGGTLSGFLTLHADPDAAIDEEDRPA